MSKKDKKKQGDASDVPMTDHERQVLRNNNWQEGGDGNWYDEHGHLLAPADVASAITEEKRQDPTPWPDVRRGAKSAPDGIDNMFVRPGSDIDSDGLMGSPAEMLARRPDVEHVVTPTVASDTPAGSDDFASLGLDSTPQATAAQA